MLQNCGWQSSSPFACRLTQLWDGTGRGAGYAGFMLSVAEPRSISLPLASSGKLRTHLQHLPRALVCMAILVGVWYPSRQEGNTDSMISCGVYLSRVLHWKCTHIAKGASPEFRVVDGNGLLMTPCLWSFATCLYPWAP